MELPCTFHEPSLQVTRVDQISDSFTVLDFGALHVYPSVSMTSL